MSLTVAVKIALAILLVYFAIVAIVFVLQRQMLYFPALERPSEQLVKAVGWTLAGISP